MNPRKDSPQESLFALGEDQAPDPLSIATYSDVSIEDPEGDPKLPEAQVSYVAGVLAQFSWGDGKRSKEQRAQSIEAARVALGSLR